MIWILIVATLIGMFSSEFLENYNHTKTRKGAGNSLSFDRFVNFTDAVFAIVITLLVLEIMLSIPKHGSDDYSKISNILGAYFLSFLTVGSLWIEHHKVFRYVKGYSNKIMVLNLMFMAVVGLVPPVITYLAEHQDKFYGFVAFYIVIGVSSVFRFFMISDAKDNSMFEMITNTDILNMKLVSLVVPIASLVGSVISMFSIEAGAVVFMFVQPITKRLLKT